MHETSTVPLPCAVNPRGNRRLPVDNFTPFSACTITVQHRTLHPPHSQHVEFFVSTSCPGVTIWDCSRLTSTPGKGVVVILTISWLRSSCSLLETLSRCLRDFLLCVLSLDVDRDSCASRPVGTVLAGGSERAWLKNVWVSICLMSAMSCLISFISRLWSSRSLTEKELFEMLYRREGKYKGLGHQCCDI